MDPEHTYLRVNARLSEVLARFLTPKFRTAIEYLCFFNAVVLLALLIVMHVNFVAQPGCAAEFSGENALEAQLIQVRITGSSRLVEEKRHNGEDHYNKGDDAVKLASNIHEPLRPPVDEDDEDGKSLETQEEIKQEDVPDKSFPASFLLHSFDYMGSCIKRVEQSMRSLEQSMRNVAQFWRIAGWEPLASTPKGDRRAVAWNKLDVAVDRGRRGKMYDPMYLYSVEKGYLILTEAAKYRHNIRTANISVSAQNSCFGNSWQRFLIDKFVGYDTILMNSLLAARGKGYLYNFQTKELYNLNYLKESGVSHNFEDYVVFKFGVMIMSMFVFFTTTMSVSFTLRETQARMLRFTVQLQHHARHRLPTFHLIFFHVFESIVFVPIMIGILFFLFEFFDDQLLAFMVLTLVWLCELFTMISVRTVISVKYFPWFFFLYFMVFHIYFFSYTYGFSYLAFTATFAFMQHLVLFFWNRFEVPAALQIQQRRRTLLHQGLHSALLSQVTRLGTARIDQARNPSQADTGTGNGDVDQSPDGSNGGGPDSSRQVLDTGIEDSQASPQVSIAGTTAAIATPILIGSVFPFSPSATLVSFLPMVREQESEAPNIPEAEDNNNRWQTPGQETGLRQRNGTPAEHEG